MLKLGVIGMGRRISHVVKTVLNMADEASVVAVADPNEETARSNMAQAKIEAEGVNFYADVDALIAGEQNLDGLFIGTRCNLHTPMAIKVAQLGLPLYLEKPVAVSWQQLCELEEAYRGREDNVVVSFPLRATPLFQSVMETVQSGRLGTISQIQAVNNVNYGGVYFGQWYRNYDDAGGLWLQKATHDFDYIRLIADSMPVSIAATASQRVYGGDKPHDLKCSGCDEIDTCIESSKAMRARGDSGGMSAYAASDDWDHMCPFSKDIRNQDSGSAIVNYANGLHASYTQNFVARRKSYRRGATIIGHDATLEFDWPTEKMRIMDHMREREDVVEVKASSGHAGGDAVLAQNFIDVLEGKAKSNSTLRDGLISAATCLAARQACHTQTFERIDVPGMNKIVPQPVRTVEPV